MADPLSSTNVFRILQSVNVHQPHIHDNTIRSPTEALAIFTHSCMLALDFRLVGLSEDDNLEVKSELGGDLKTLPTNWAASSDFFSFRYAHQQSAMQYLTKISRLGSKAVIMALGLGDEKISSVEVVLGDFFSSSYFPHKLSSEENFSVLQFSFNSEWRIKDLISLLKVKIIQPLIPNLYKEGYQESPASSNASNNETTQQPPSPASAGLNLTAPPIHSPLAGIPSRVPGMPRNPEEPPGFEDEFQLLRHYNRPSHFGSPNPLSIGDDDLNPPGLPSNPRLTGPFFGGGSHQGEGMYPSPNHPMFRGGRGNNADDPRFPLGSRYDPVGPGDMSNRSRGFPGPGFPGGFGPSDFI